ncbi:MAG: hypothetical protein IJ877_01095 [Candidatus Gastranaerophilales bacterium]|nr:hypothetical protein [Candidatus Gastranaerophilales bacterium]
MPALVSFCSGNLLEPKKTLEIRNETQKTFNADYFNLANIVDSFLNNEENKTEIKEDKENYRQEFISITSKFNQGNATSAYMEYSNLIDKLDSDIMLLNLSQILYKIGFFSLAHKSEDKIIYKNQYFDNINDLETSYKPKSQLSYDDEIFFAKIYSSIFFDNSAHEANLELLSKKEQYQKNDYYNYLLSQSYFEQKDYHKAQNAINKAISLNNENINYKLLKSDILFASKKYQDALDIIKKLEKNQKIIDFKDTIQSKKQLIIAQNGKNDKEKKYALVYKTYLEGNYEKTKKDCLSILNFDKNNDKIIALYAKAELASGNIERANAYFINAYRIEKNNLDTLIGLGDIRYIHKDYKGSIKMYKNALKLDKLNSEILIKLELAQRGYAKNPKDIIRTTQKLDKLPQNHFSYYNCAISIAQKNSVLKEEFLKKSLSVNPMYKNALGEMIALDLENKNFKNAKGLIKTASFTLEKNYYYYYLLGLYNQAENKKQDAIQFYKTSLDLNPSFEIANVKLLKLIPNKSEEI